MDYFFIALKGIQSINVIIQTHLYKSALFAFHKISEVFTQLQFNKLKATTTDMA